MISERNTLKNCTFGNKQDVSGREIEFWALKNSVLQSVGLKAEVRAVTCRRIERMVSILSSIGGNLVLSIGLKM